MVRTHTFNLVDLERVLSRPVCSRSSSRYAFTNPRVMPRGPASGERYRPRSVARGAPTVWPMCRIAPARRELYICPD